MFKNWDQPYPFNNNFKHNVKTIGLVIMGFMLIMLYFQPFGINFLGSANNGYFVLGAGLLSGGVLFIYSLILPNFLPNLFDPEKWTVRKEIRWNFAIFVSLALLIGVLAWVCRVFDFTTLPIFKMGALALLPLILFNLINYNHSLKKKFNKVLGSGLNWLEEELHLEKKEVAKVRIEADNGKDSFEENPHNIILISSASNYIKIYYREGQTIHKRMLRNTLSAVEVQFESYSWIQKCHRCWLVNLEQMSSLTRNAQGYRLEVTGLDFQIPVSRKYSQKIREFFQK